MVLYGGNPADYLFTSDSKGMQLVIESQGIAAFPDAAGFKTGVGLLSSFGYKPVFQ